MSLKSNYMQGEGPSRLERLSTRREFPSALSCPAGGVGRGCSRHGVQGPARFSPLVLELDGHGHSLGSGGTGGSGPQGHSEGPSKAAQGDRTPATSGGVLGSPPPHQSLLLPHWPFRGTKALAQMNKRNPNTALSFRSWGMKVPINQPLVSGRHGSLYLQGSLFRSAGEFLRQLQPLTGPPGCSGPCPSHAACGRQGQAPFQGRTDDGRWWWGSCPHCPGPLPAAPKAITAMKPDGDRACIWETG